ncbi:hypothetical protein IV203_026052 [Nitzschia inconspicua]|uniref:Uncharacterized protein n=1 Tax=Nitzschia inconspicua TaxID=303405 RepID=A0A9K3LII9_9STRA|nr:hypothetical protein IV203_009453 [Nitzschia inconspicua]KAG7362692.1 hypothetical protein IV203_026052 [Nitzschia inconspicua]
MSTSQVGNKDGNYVTHSMEDVPTEWNEEILVATSNHQSHVGGTAEEESETTNGYITAGDDGYSHGYHGNDMEAYEDAYDTLEYSYHPADGPSDMDGGPSFGTKVNGTQDGASASFNNQEYSEEEYAQDQEYGDGHPYDSSLVAEQALYAESENGIEGGEEEGDYNENHEEHKQILGYQQIIHEYDDGYDIERSTDESGELLVDPGVVQQVRVSVDEMHQEMRSLTNKLLEAIEGYAQTLIETEKVYAVVQQQEIAESERLDQCEVEVMKAISGFHFESEYEEDKGDEEDDYVEEEYQDDEVGEYQENGKDEIHPDDEDVYHDGEEVLHQDEEVIPKGTEWDNLDGDEN